MKRFFAKSDTLHHTMTANNLRQILCLLILTMCSVVSANAAESDEAEVVVMTQEFKSNTTADWEPLIPTSKGSSECRSLTNDCVFGFENVSQSANGRYLVLYADGSISLPKVDGRVTRLEVQLYEDQPFSSLCNLELNNQHGNRKRLLEVDARDESMVGQYVAFPYDLSVVYPEEDVRFVLSSEKKVHLTGIRITYIPNEVAPLDAPRFLLPSWMTDDHCFSSSFSLSIESDAEGAELLYSTDSAVWTTYVAPITIEDSCTIYAKAVKNGRQSEVSQMSFTKISTRVSSIEELLEVGPSAQSYLDGNKLIANEIGLFTIDTPLQVIAHIDNIAFVTDNTDNFSNCIAICLADALSQVEDNATIVGGLKGYFVMVDDVTPMIYVTERVEAHTVKPESVHLIDILNDTESYVSKYVALKQCGYDADSQSLTFDGAPMLPIDNLFNIELPAAKSVDIEGIIVYSSTLGRMAIAPIAISYESSIKSVANDNPKYLDIKSLPTGTRIYSLDGKCLPKDSIETGLYIVQLPGQHPTKAILTRR